MRKKEKYQLNSAINNYKDNSFVVDNFWWYDIPLSLILKEKYFNMKVYIPKLKVIAFDPITCF